MAIPKCPVEMGASSQADGDASRRETFAESVMPIQFMTYPVPQKPYGIAEADTRIYAEISHQ
jgi:hypothetical protein